jgi:hypothetical protein
MIREALDLLDKEALIRVVGQFEFPQSARNGRCRPICVVVLAGSTSLTLASLYGEVSSGGLKPWAFWTERLRPEHLGRIDIASG